MRQTWPGEKKLSHAKPCKLQKDGTTFLMCTAPFHRDQLSGRWALQLLYPQAADQGSYNAFENSHEKGRETQISRKSESLLKVTKILVLFTAEAQKFF